MSWFYNLKMAKKIIVLVIFMMTFLCITAYQGYFFTSELSKSSESMYQECLLSVKWLNQSLYLAQSNKVDLIKIINDNSYNNKQRYVNDIKTRAEEVNKLVGLFSAGGLDNYEQQEIAAFKTSVANYRTKRSAIIQLALSGKNDEAKRLFTVSEGAIDEFSNIIKKLADYNEKQANVINLSNSKKSKSAIQEILTISLVGLVISVLLGLFIARVISAPLSKAVKTIEEVANGNLKVDNLETKYTDEVGVLGSSINSMTFNLSNLVRQVTESVDEISSSSEEMSAATEQTAQGAQVQANNAAYCLDNINAINNLVQLINTNVESTVQYSKSTEEHANSGKTEAENAVIKVNQINENANEIAGSISELSRLSSDIEVIVDLIKNIANQTNLLALNAAIEAARAGEHGKGFAVVADEVKKLAGQSVDATDKITSMIKEIQNKTEVAVDKMEQGVQIVEDGVVIIKRVGGALEEIYDNAKLSTSNVNEISKEVNNLAINSNNVVRMVEEISSVTEEQSASLQQISASTVSLTKVSEKLVNLVSVFKV